MSSKEIGGIRELGPIGLSVRDIDRSARFYKALGFAPGEKVALPRSGAHALGAKGANARLTMQRVVREGTKVLLLQVEPAPTGEPGGGAALELGLSHFELMVDNVDRVAAEIVALGGKVLKETRSHLTDAGPVPLDVLFCQDPDGTLIALVSQGAS